MKTRLTFLVLLILLSLLLFLLRDWLALVYQTLLLLLCSLVLPAEQQSVNLGYESSLRLIPYFALLFATPGLVWKRRLMMTVVGLLIFIAIDMLIILVWQSPPAPFAHGQVSFAHLLSSLVWDMLGHWLLPFLLWLIAVHRQFGEVFTPAGMKVESARAS